MRRILMLLPAALIWACAEQPTQPEMDFDPQPASRTRSNSVAATCELPHCNPGFGAGGGDTGGPASGGDGTASPREELEVFIDESVFREFTLFAIEKVASNSGDAFVFSSNLEVVSSSGVTLTEDGEPSTLAAGDLLSRSDLANLAFGPNAELRLRDPATGQIFILASAADALALGPLWTPPLQRISLPWAEGTELREQMLQWTPAQWSEHFEVSKAMYEGDGLPADEFDRIQQEIQKWREG